MGERSPWRVRLKPRGRPECAGWRLRCLRGRRHTGPERGEGPGLTTRCPARTSAQCGSEDVPPTSANSPTTKQHCQSVQENLVPYRGGEVYGSPAGLRRCTFHQRHTQQQHNTLNTKTGIRSYLDSRGSRSRNLEGLRRCNKTLYYGGHIISYHSTIKLFNYPIACLKHIKKSIFCVEIEPNFALISKLSSPYFGFLVGVATKLISLNSRVKRKER